VVCVHPDDQQEMNSVQPFDEKEMLRKKTRLDETLRRNTGKLKKNRAVKCL